MQTTKTDIVVDFKNGNTGNFLAVTQTLDPELDKGDAVYGLVTKDTFPSNFEVDGGYLQPLGADIHARPMRKLSIIDINNGRKFILDYNAHTGQFEISNNDFPVTVLNKLHLEVHRINWNRTPRPVNG